MIRETVDSLFVLKVGTNGNEYGKVLTMEMNSLFSLLEYIRKYVLLYYYTIVVKGGEKSQEKMTGLGWNPPVRSKRITRKKRTGRKGRKGGGTEKSGHGTPFPNRAGLETQSCCPELVKTAIFFIELNPNPGQDQRCIWMNMIATIE